ncbi:MAG TPA: ATP synthase F0 subunit B [Nitrospirota bacterium]|jgi:F-type H+-transporting ATPase subunit b
MNTQGDGKYMNASSFKISAKWSKVLFAALCMLALTAAAAFAAEEAEEVITARDWLWRIFNFSIIAGVLIYFLAKPLAGYLKARTAGIETAIAESKAAREDALKRLAEVEARLKDKEAEKASLVSIAEDNGKKEKLEMAAEAGRVVAGLSLSAKENIDAELIKAKAALRREAALLAVELAEKMVKENIKKEDQVKMVEEYISKVGG